MITVAIGSKNPNKVKAVEIAFKLAGLKVKVTPTEPPKDIPPEPIGLEEIASGAMRRARHALGSVASAEFGVGIEAGIVKVLNMHLDLTLAVVIDRDGTATLGLAPAFMVPPRFVDELLAGKELNEVAERYYGVPNIGRRFGLIGAVTRGFINRVDLNVEALYMALIPRMPWNRDLYGITKQ